MKQRTNVVLLATLVSASAWAQDVTVYGTTMAQMWKSETPGFDKATYAPATQFLGIDATKLGTDALSLHLFGWGRMDLADASSPSGKSGGNLTYGYLQYRFTQANAELKAGRFAIYQGVGVEQVDGISGRADLRGGFNLSGFVGKPVLYKAGDAAQNQPLSETAQREYELQRDFIFGTRIGLRLSRAAEVGVSFLQDGTTPAKAFANLPNTDYTRKQVSGDVRYAPLAGLEFSGRTVLDVASHMPPLKAKNANPSRVAEHDYTLTYKFSPLIVVATNYTERNFQAYFAGTNMPNLFRQTEKDKHHAYGGSLTLGSADSLTVVGDIRRTTRETYGVSYRAGADLRWNFGERKYQSGFGFHWVTAPDVASLTVKVPAYGLGHKEFRAWFMYEAAAVSASLDAILHTFDDKANPNLYGQSSLYELVASLGYKASEHFKFSGDLSYGADAFAKKEVRGLLRSEFRFGFGGKGGK